MDSGYRHGLSVAVLGHEQVTDESGTYVAFVIEVEKNGKKHVVKHRFSRILSDLHAPLVKFYLVDPPDKHAVGSIFSSKEKFLNNRKKELQTYFDALLDQSTLDTDNRYFCAFFNL